MGYELGSLLSYFDINSTKGMRALWSCAEYSRKKEILFKDKKKNAKTSKKECEKSYKPGLGDDLYILEAEGSANTLFYI